jgi:hypothetical protein
MLRIMPVSVWVEMAQCYRHAGLDDHHDILEVPAPTLFEYDTVIHATQRQAAGRDASGKH